MPQVLSNLRIEFSRNLFPEDITSKYDKFLFHKNNMFKEVRHLIYESIQEFETPGLSLVVQNISGLNNQPKRGAYEHPILNKVYPGTSPLNEILDSGVFNVTFKNQIINWMYFYEFCYKYYKRQREVDAFDISVIMMDAAEIPMFKMVYGNCFISQIPGLQFGFNQSFSELKTFNVGFTYESLSVDFIIPNFDIETFNF